MSEWESTWLDTIINSSRTYGSTDRYLFASTVTFLALRKQRVTTAYIATPNPEHCLTSNSHTPT